MSHCLISVWSIFYLSVTLVFASRDFRRAKGVSDFISEKLLVLLFSENKETNNKLCFLPHAPLLGASFFAGF